MSHSAKLKIPKETHNKTNSEVIAPSVSDEITLFDLVLIIWKGKFCIAICALLTTIAGVIYALTSPEVFSTSSYFITKTGKSSGMSSLGQLAALAGVPMGNSGAIDPSEYLDKVIQDQQFISGLYERKWLFKGDSLPLEKILGVEKDTTLANWSHAYFMAKIEAVRKGKLLSIGKDPKVGVLTLNTNMPDPRLAYDVNRYTLDFISNYIRNSIQSQAKEKRSFIEDRLKEVKIDLQNAENNLAKFKERNLMSSSPQVMLEEGRLVRQVTINQEIYLQFQKQYEMARIEELDDQPLIQIVRNPEVSIMRSKPKRTQTVIFSFVIGMVIGFLCVLVLKYSPVVKTAK